MKKIAIHYWRIRSLIPSLPHESEFEYSQEKVNEIVQTVLEHGLNVMIWANHNNGATLLICIDSGKFRQM